MSNDGQWGNPSGYPQHGAHGPQPDHSQQHGRPQPPDHDGHGPGVGPGRPGGDRGWLWALIAVVVTAALCTGVYFLFLDGDDDESTSAEGQRESDTVTAVAPPTPSAPAPTAAPAPTPGSEEPSTTESDGSGGPTVVDVPIGTPFMTHNGGVVTLDSVEEDFTCGSDVRGLSGAYALEFTVVGSSTAGTSAPVPGTTLESSSGSIGGSFNTLACLADSSRALPGFVDAGETATGLVIVTPPTNGAFTLEYDPSMGVDRQDTEISIARWSIN
ncbi:hypothetical protein ACPYO6_01995 [Georgenia sp. Z1344]|uniref:hypothetical protein n=1 Tax=Georgenia sp. Z1344 TaxID=3416706 RepID=UPI003CE9256B